MLYCHLLFFGAFSLVATSAHPQVGRNTDSSSTGNVHVHVVLANDRSAGMHLRVQLMSGGSTPVSEAFTDDRGEAEFNMLPVGEYHVVVTGSEIEQADSGTFEVDRRKMSQTLYITVRSSSNSKPNIAESSRTSVAVVDLDIPADAKREFDKASDAMARQDWPGAQQRLKQATAIYPRYALAYNNLAAVYSHMNDGAHQREALEKAISLNEHFVPALVNLAKLCFQDGHSARAETLLQSALVAEPNNANTMMLLAQAQLLNKHFEAAIATAHDVHSLPHQGLAVIHFIAARAFERQNRPQDALIELRMFLAEEPAGARANQVRKEMTQIEHQATR
jgi:tetratricopeptide (TPR) repeat protein